MSVATAAHQACQQSPSIEGEEEKYIIRIRKKFDKEKDAEKGENVIVVEGDGIAEPTTAATSSSSSPVLSSVNDDTTSTAPMPPIHLSVDEELQSGTAVVRSLAHFEAFDSQIRQEILGSATASVGQDGTFLGPLPRRKTGDRHRSLAHPLEEFLESVLRIPAAVRSAAMASFLNTVASPISESRPHMYHDYLLPSSMQDESNPISLEFHTIPRLGPFSHAVKTLPPGWWIVWQFRIESGISGGQVEFSLYIDQPSVENNGEEEESTRSDGDQSLENTADSSSLTESFSCRELVHREECSVGGDQPFTGSYRFSPDVSESARVTLQFTNVGSWSILGGSRVQLECATVPHEAFRAACEAAREQNDADARRSRAPLLYAILDSTEEDEEDSGIHLKVESYVVQQDVGDSERQDDESGDALIGEEEAEDGTKPEKPVVDVPSVVAEKENELQKLRAEVAKLRTDRDYVRGELGRISKVADEGKRKLQLMASEKRVWSVARQEIQTELSRLSAELVTERQAKSDLAIELETCRLDVQRLRGEVKFLECTAPTEEDEHRQKEQINIAQSAVNEMKRTVTELETEVGLMKSKNAALGAAIENQKKSYKELLGRAKSEVDEVKMSKRILEGKVRHLEQELRRAREGLSPRKKSTRNSAKVAPRQTPPCSSLDPKVASFKHPDERLNTQLDILRDRHAQLVILLDQNPNNERNMELIGKIEKAIHDIVANALESSSAAPHS